MLKNLFYNALYLGALLTYLPETYLQWPTLAFRSLHNVTSFSKNKCYELKRFLKRFHKLQTKKRVVKSPFVSVII